MRRREPREFRPLRGRCRSEAPTGRNAHARVLLLTPPGMKMLDGGGIRCDLMAETAWNADLRSAQRAEGPRTTCRMSPWATEIQERLLHPVAPKERTIPQVGAVLCAARSRSACRPEVGVPIGFSLPIWANTNCFAQWPIRRSTLAFPVPVSTLLGLVPRRMAGMEAPSESQRHRVPSIGDGNIAAGQRSHSRAPRSKEPDDESSRLLVCRHRSR